MKLELKENMHYRTYSGFINKITSIKDFNEREYLLNGFYINKDTIKKASHNIIDLIERFDLVNGYLVICKMYEDEKDIPTIIKCVGDYYFKEEDIKSVITHEQFSQMEYKVGD